MAFVYTNKDWESEVNDFGDDYHKPPIEDQSMLDRDLVSRVKGLKRRYRDFGEYSHAMELLEKYMSVLVEAYGGKKKYKFMKDLGLVKEYIPILPTLRKIKRNIPFIKGKIKWVPDETVNDSDYGSPSAKDINIDDIEVNFKKAAKGKMFKDMFKRDLNRERIAADLQQIEEYYSKKEKKPTKLSKKVYKRRVKRLKKLSNFEHPPVKQRLKDYEIIKFMGDDYVKDPNAVVNYKGVTLNVQEVDEIETRDILRKAGFRIGLEALGKKSRKVIIRSKKAKRKAKKKKKKAVKLNKRYLEQFGSGGYDAFGEFDHTIKTLVGKSLRGEV